MCLFDQKLADVRLDLGRLEWLWDGVWHVVRGTSGLIGFVLRGKLVVVCERSRGDVVWMLRTSMVSRTVDVV